MNFVKKLSMIALASLLLASCKDVSKDTVAAPSKDEAAAAAKPKVLAANLETATFKIDGMTCPMGCAATIEKKLAGMDGVAKAKVDFDNKTATVSFDPAKQTAESFVETVQKINDGAYKVSDVKSSGDKAYYSAADHNKDKKKKKKADKDAAAADKKDGKPACCSSEAKSAKKASCCAEGAKAKGGSM